MPQHPMSRQIARSAAVAAALGTALALSACASPSASSAPSSTDTLLPAAEGAVSYPLTLDTPFGETTLDERPERIAIITASTVDTDALIALGGLPVFAPSTIERNPWLDEDTVAGIDDLWESEAGQDVSAEAIAASDPDLIINLAAYETFDQGRFDKLSAIAPILYAPAEELTWQELTRTLGETLDLAETAEKAVEDAEDSVAATREAHPEFAGRTAAHVIVYPEEWGAYYASHTGADTAALFDELGFDLPPAAAEFSEEDVVAGELVGMIDADFLLLSTFGTDSEYFLESDLVANVPVVRDGRVIVDDADPATGINSFAWGLNVQSPLSVPWLIDQLAAFGAESLD
ncbi:ABC transporter substrate-binding protein [Microbacterium esteraromaticum]|uniref:ABC transporter substrate-binding protein n=1 Tax=Microbacterium esteraromaticum TaxID=57043 RepID=UPI001A8C5F0A|nr:ABC transporter substrate-binding protein [Microbacterium esteraromaticum]MBN8425312.1 ABC transporter substrate-binding protein [Microbacterium esteraromaticum]